MKKLLVGSVVFVWLAVAVYFFVIFPERRPFIDFIPVDPGSSAPPVEPANPSTESDGDYTCSNTWSRVEPGDDYYFRWTSESGVTNVSTEHPGLPDVEIVSLNGTVLPRYFRLETDMRGGSYIPYFDSRLSAQMTVVYNLLGDWIGDDRLRHLEIRMIVFPTGTDYRRYALTYATEESANAGGYYSAARNEAVTWMKASDEDTFETARHESAHVVFRGLFGDLPDWLNEGFAEYIETLAITGQVKSIRINPEWLNQARRAVSAGYPGSLAEYMALSEDEWDADDYHGNDHYAIAWSLVFFLASSDNGRSTLASLLSELADNYCEPVDTVAALGRLYPGGFERFQGDYLQWLASVNANTVHSY